MKIAIISNTAWNILNFRMGLIRFLQENGHEVIVIAPHDHTVKEIVQKTNSKYFQLKYLERKGYNPFNEIMLIKELYTIFKEQKVDFSISYTIKPNIYCSIASCISKTKSIVNITGLGFVFLKDNLPNKLAKIVLKFSLRFPSAIVFQNNTDKALFEAKKLGNASIFHLINGSGINTSNYKPLENKTIAKDFNFLFIGRLLFDKGIQEFVNASKYIMNDCKDARFQIVGALDEGNPSAISKVQLDQWLGENPNLTYLGSQHDVKPFLQNATAIVLPSYREGIPRVLLEAMAFEKPFITVNSPGCADVTQDGVNGLLAKVGSSADLAKKMKQMYQFSEETLQNMGKAGRKIVLEKYDEKIVVKEYLKLILSLSS